jgi:ABC-type nitrate/sulfonate/bicarbonate transport system permease component
VSTLTGPVPTTERDRTGRIDWTARPYIWALQAIPFLALCGVWYLAARLIANSAVLPTPAEVWIAAGELLARGALLNGAQSSFTTLLLGTGVTAAVTLPLASLLALNATAAALLQPAIRFMSNVPAIALIPLFIVWFGFSQQAVYATLVYTATIPLLSSVITGIQKIPPVYPNGLKPLGASTLRTISDVYLPGAVPGIVVGIRLAFSYGWRAVVAGELIVGTGGLGEMLSRARSTNQVDEIVAVMIVIAILFLVIDRLFLFPWERVVTSRWASL